LVIGSCYDRKKIEREVGTEAEVKGFNGRFGRSRIW